METQKLGEFNIESGKVVVSDPCYDLDVTCLKVLENVKKGKWIAEAEERGYQPDQVKIYLLSKGYSTKDINEAIKRIKKK